MKRWHYQTIVAIAIILLLGGIAGIFRSAYLKSPQREVPLVYSNKAMLNELWIAYKTQNLDVDTQRTIDKQQGNLTTSEGESYTMLRAVWMDDKTTFDKNWEWTQANLQRSDKLFSWRYGELDDGSYGIQKNLGGENTASDADQDIALSLIMAYSRWGDTTYLRQAQEIITSLWKNEVVLIQGKPVLAANQLEKNNQKVLVNPSYFAPYAYKTFAKVDPTHDWTALSDNTYTLLSDISDDKLDKSTSSGLQPDWILIDRTTGERAATTNANLTTNFSYDAIRVSWRLGLDYQWFKDDRAKQILNKFSLLSDQWEQTGQIKARYSHDGQPLDDYESIAAYGAAMGYFIVADTDNAKEVYEKKLLTLYNPDTQRWVNPLSYYDDNLAWFGIALTQQALPNLTEQKTDK